jgi:hypothetical protein
METERLKILEMLESGEIDANEALALLAVLDGPEDEVRLARQPGEEEGDVYEPAPAADPLAVQRSRWARFWVYPLMAGGAVLIIGSLVMALVYATNAARGWLVCGWLPMILGLLVMLLAWWTRRAKWLHVRIREGGESKLALSFPLPLAFGAWVLRLVKPFVPQLRETGVDELIMAMRASGRDEPISIDVQDDENGEQVQVYIG